VAVRIGLHLTPGRVGSSLSHLTKLFLVYYSSSNELMCPSYPQLKSWPYPALRIAPIDITVKKRKQTKWSLTNEYIFYAT